MKVVIAGGGTAGHVFPSIAVADRLRAGGVSVEFVGSPAGQEAALVPAAGYRFHPVASAPLRRELSLRAAAAPLVALRSVARCGPLVADAGAVLGMGGYASVPAVVAARRARVPVVLHEQNAVPGLANRVLARIATTVAITFEDARRRLPGGARVEVTGLPLRRGIVEATARLGELADEAGRELSLAAGRTTVLVTGGSQGALHVNRTVAGAIPLLSGRADLQLLVLTGRAHADQMRDAASRPMDLVVRALPFLDRMELALAVADLAVARAGAGTIHELAVCGVAPILVPYPHATGGHQEANARELERAGAAEVYLDHDLSPRGLAGRIAALASDEARRTGMGERARGWAKADADARVAEIVMEVARG